ncbi:hypothetical protein ABWU93_11350 [Xanthomonas translucens pv. translucens]|uniref:hypothetical protein n=1 Tax=Xanthomonas campestris pv. translucens TaxID=343 RepID=UPI003F7095C7
MKVAVVAHWRREMQALRLQAAVAADAVFIDPAEHGAAWNHRRALRWAAAQSERVVVLEDDAIPVSGFRELAPAWLGRFPAHLVSFYLGTGRPPQWQPKIEANLRAADAAGQDHIRLPQLIHGVAYSLPLADIRATLDGLSRSQPADYAIGSAWRRAGGGEVVYPSVSLVDHAEGPSVERHPDGQARTQRRHAWRLQAPERVPCR